MTLRSSSQQLLMHTIAVGASSSLITNLELKVKNFSTWASTIQL